LDKIIDLKGKMCPLPVVIILKMIDNMTAGQEMKFIFDDPMVLKSVPEEMEDYQDVEISIFQHKSFWEMTIVKKNEV